MRLMKIRQNEFLPRTAEVGLNTKTEKWTKKDAKTGKFTDVKSDGTPFKGVTKK